MKRNRSNHSIAGFTLIEVLVIIIMVGILFAIAAPSWVGFLNRQRITTARDQTFELLRSAQAEAKRTKVSRAIVFGNTADQRARVVVVPVTDNDATPATVLAGVTTSDGRWQVLGNGDIKAGAIKISGKPSQGTETASGAIIFDTYGNVNPNISSMPYTITIQAAAIVSPKRCVRVTTLLGAMLPAEDSDCNL
ncbi:MAG: type II secretion system GspH family protein [Phormidesmis sp. CAN_BIN44]|nr:type II secretion system GspH family protein [Phormidesmis sp. CAN_BIN44]